MDGEDHDLAALIRGGALDRATIERLKAADRAAMRASLSKYLDDAQVERILARVDALVAALD
jgi:hypothetical protein